MEVDHNDEDNDDGIELVEELTKSPENDTTNSPDQSTPGDNDNKSQNQSPDPDEGSDSKSPADQTPDGDNEDDETNMPTISISRGIFDADDDDDDEQNASSVDISNMMEIEINDDSDSSVKSADEDSTGRSRPKRAAARAAENNIRALSTELKGNAADDPEFLGTCDKSTKSDSGKRRCHQCKKLEASKIVVQQFGTDIHLCSDKCFNAFRNPDPSRRPLACAKCGALGRDIDTSKTYYWETMNFCTDVCVANLQMEVGAQCSTCSKKVMWNSLGKYCVRFGSDVRQFCTATCLEMYKKNARVCFHCQLDIKKLDNVVLANIPAKSQAKEFCSQECVEMYVEQNLHQQIVSKPEVMISCSICSLHKKLYKQLVIQSVSSRTCSEACWKRLLTNRQISIVSKCETCTKFIQMESILPSHYVASDSKTYGFCSPTCKNVFVLKHRQIQSCTTCKVKKYNYDLIQFVNSRNTEFVVCSLNCLPRPSQYILNIKTTLLSSEQSGSNLGLRIQSVSSLGRSTVSTLTNGTNSFSYSGLAGSSEITLRQACDDDIIEIRDMRTSEEEVSLEDERWAECETLVIVREPEPVPMRNKACMVKPLRITKTTQTDTEELWEMPRVEMKSEEIVKYVPVPVPFPVYLPFPFYALQAPTPVAFPVPVPIPIPVPVDINLMSSKNCDPENPDEDKNHSETT